MALLKKWYTECYVCTLSQDNYSSAAFIKLYNCHEFSTAKATISNIVYKKGKKSKYSFKCKIVSITYSRGKQNS